MEFVLKKIGIKKFLIWGPYLILLWGLFMFNTSIATSTPDNGSGGTNKQHRSTFTNNPNPSSSHNPNTLVIDPIRTLVLASTLDGSLTALGQRTGDIRWITKDEPMIKVPSDGQNSSPYFLPDPRSGSLYLLGRKGQLKKLPFTIPQLVSMAPCKSSEGLLYTGKKMDFWLSLDPITGEKSEVVSLDTSSCPAPGDNDKAKESPNNVNMNKAEKLLLGKSEYVISMIDGGKKWNVSFHDYSSVDMDSEKLQEYGLIHFTSPSTGTILTYEKATGELLWEKSLSSPIIALYSIDMDLKNLISIPFTPVASETLDRLKAPTTPRPTSPLLPTLYIGECPYGLYAVSSLVDDSVLTITSSAYGFPLLEGPDKSQTHNKDEAKEPIQQIQDPLHVDTESNSPNSESFVLIGHYEVPPNTSGNPAPLNQITGASDDLSNRNSTISNPNNTVPNPNQGYQQPIPMETNSGSSHGSAASIITPAPTIPIQPSSFNQFPPPSPTHTRKETPHVILLGATIVLGILVTLGIGYYIGFKKFHWKRPGQPVRYLSGNNGIATVGKISFDTTAKLGYGCEGTVVYKGTFDDRDVAVKRILPECFEFGEREVALLKESDDHHNVIRYFCTETDGQFRYIALELCAASLHDWISGNFVHDSINSMTVLQEATNGLAYLHKLKIVHRDIKPANVLLSVCPTSDTVKAMISDFGLCKKLAKDRHSFSRRSGVITGTEGWIAPEMLKKDNSIRTTYAVDVFSLGCVYFYVLTQGEHPFGRPVERNLNIELGNSDIQHEKVQRSPQGAAELIAAMISSDPTRRPPLPAVLTHPMFWSPDKILQFFLEVSDRIEKEDEKSCAVLRKLENEAHLVVRHDWTDHICDELKNDLRQYRTYKGHSVRDLLRALRNKKNHYRELTEATQKSLGHIPDQFVAYWIDRFPNLLPYTWRKFELIKSEPMFSNYYLDYFSWNSSDDLIEEVDSALDSDMRSSPDDDPNWRNSPKTEGIRQRQKSDNPFWRPNSQYKHNRYNNRKWRNPNPKGSPPNPNDPNVPSTSPGSASRQPAAHFRPPPGLEHIMRQPPPDF